MSRCSVWRAMSSEHFRLTQRATSAALGLSGYVRYFPLSAFYALEPGSPIKGFHEDTEESEEILSQRHKDTKVEEPFMASYLSFLLRVFVSL